MKTLADRVQSRLDELGWIQEDLAKRVGVSQTAIFKITSGKTSKPRNILEIAKALRVSPDWLVDGIGENQSVSLQTNAEPAPSLGKFSQVPVVGTAQLGDNGHWTELEYPVGHGDGYINYPTRDPNAYALRCMGDSMRPRIREGEFVIIEPNSEPISGDEVLVKSLDGRVMIKTLLYQRDGRLHLLSVNEAHPPQSIPLEDVDKIHPVVAIVKKALWVSQQ